jgi:hypothetical protein
VGFATDAGKQLTPLEKSPYPLAFVATAGAEERTESDAAQASRTYRCEVTGLGGFQKEGLVENVATGRTWRLVCDEGVYLRGADMAPPPLMHWAAGLHGDVTARIARALLAAGLDPANLVLTMTQGFGVRGSFARGEAVGLVYGLTWNVKLPTAAPEAVIGQLIASAMAGSPAYAAMTSAREGAFSLYINGRRQPVTGVPQSTAPAQVDPFLRHNRAPEPSDPAAETSQLMTRRAATPDRPGIELTDDEQGTVQWHIQARGTYHRGTGLVESRVGFAEGEGGASFWILLSDEANQLAPDPLAYFSIGTAFCFHTQLCRYAAIRRIQAELPRLSQISRFTGVGGDAQADHFDTHLFLRGTARDEQATSLLAAAANTCYAHRALAVPAASTTRIETA